jgi:hypothetical protein
MLSGSLSIEFAKVGFLAMSAHATAISKPW